MKKKSPKIDPHLHGQLVFYQGIKVIHLEKIVLFKHVVLELLNIFMEKRNTNPYFAPY